MIFRLAKSEDVQYFQFDSMGNMYVYEPGSGFGGKCKKFSLGDDFNATWSDDCSETSSQMMDSGIISSMSSDVHSQYECSQFVYSSTRSQRYVY